EPEISRQGDAIVVDLPGIDDRDRAIGLVGQTAELRGRPVRQQQENGIPAELLEQVATTVAPDADADTETTTTVPTDGSTTTAPDATTTTLPAEESDEGVAGIVGMPAQDGSTTTTAAETTTT